MSDNFWWLRCKSISILTRSYLISQTLSPSFISFLSSSYRSLPFPYSLSLLSLPPLPLLFPSSHILPPLLSRLRPILHLISLPPPPPSLPPLPNPPPMKDLLAGVAPHSSKLPVHVPELLVAPVHVASSTVHNLLYCPLLGIHFHAMNT